MKRILITGLLAIAALSMVALLPTAKSDVKRQSALVASDANFPTETCLAGPVQSMLEVVSPVVQAKGETTTGSCDDYSAVCEDVGWREYKSCSYWGLGDCWCKGQRAYNQCMKEVNCPGVSAEGMQAQGCSCLNKSCLP